MAANLPPLAKHGRVVSLCTAMPTTALKRPYLNPNAHYEPAVRFSQQQVFFSSQVVVARGVEGFDVHYYTSKSNDYYNYGSQPGKEKENTLNRAEHGYPSGTLNLALGFIVRRWVSCGSFIRRKRILDRLRAFGLSRYF